MKKKILSVAISAALIPAFASADFRITNDEEGEVLIYPYYSVMEGNQTFITVTNRDYESKAVKVRFREGVGSRDVLDFTLYLSAYDHWSGVVIRQGDDVYINTSDKSCTVPEVGTYRARFSTTRISDDYTATSKADRISEGHIEFITMTEM